MGIKKLKIHYQTLMIGIEMMSEMSAIFNQLIRLTIREGFIYIKEIAPLINVNRFHEMSINEPNYNIPFAFYCRAHNFINFIQKVAKSHKT